MGRSPAPSSPSASRPSRTQAGKGRAQQGLSHTGGEKVQQPFLLSGMRRGGSFLGAVVVSGLLTAAASSAEQG